MLDTHTEHNTKSKLGGYKSTSTICFLFSFVLYILTLFYLLIALSCNAIMGFFSLPDFSITIGPSPKKVTKKSNPQFLDEIAKQRMHKTSPHIAWKKSLTLVATNDCWKYYGINIWMQRCKDSKTNNPFWKFGVTRDNEVEPTTNTFTCNLMPRKQPCDFDHLLNVHNDVLRELVWHRESEKCDCDFEWMSRRQTEQKTLRMCAGTPESMKSIWRLMNEHDRLCTCGCFGAPKDEQSWELVQKQ